mmetsp:Transcript_21657/g.56540  ORF Transcript_21657/g.56540 Transcript_21657/m.56540 type:complete len:306 (-) Transcript_21657:318-1235(-)
MKFQESRGWRAGDGTPRRGHHSAMTVSLPTQRLPSPWGTARPPCSEGARIHSRSTSTRLSSASRILATNMACASAKASRNFLVFAAVDARPGIASTSISGPPLNAAFHHMVTPRTTPAFSTVTRTARRGLPPPPSPAPLPPSVAGSGTDTISQSKSSTSSGATTSAKKELSRSGSPPPCSVTVSFSRVVSTASAEPLVFSGTNAYTVTVALSCAHTYPGPRPPFSVCTGGAAAGAAAAAAGTATAAGAAAGAWASALAGFELPELMVTLRPGMVTDSPSPTLYTPGGPRSSSSSEEETSIFAKRE